MIVSHCCSVGDKAWILIVGTLRSVGYRYLPVGNYNKAGVEFPCHRCAAPSGVQENLGRA